MILGSIIGSLDSTINHPFYTGKKLLVVEKHDSEGGPSGSYLIAVDHGVDAGVGDTVLVIDEGNSARQIVGSSSAPIRSIIVGIVDEVQKTA